MGALFLLLSFCALFSKTNSNIHLILIAASDVDPSCNRLKKKSQTTGTWAFPGESCLFQYSGLF